MINRLEKILKGTGNFVKRGALTATLILGTTIGSLGLASCKPPMPDPTPTAPTVSLSVNPPSGNAPLPAQIVADAQDSNGDVAMYEVFADYNGNGKEDAGEVIVPQQATSVNTSYTFNQTGTFNIIAKATNKQGLTGTASESVTVRNPSVVDYLDVSGQVVNDKTGIGAKAKVKIFDSANEISPVDITDTDNNGYFSKSTAKKISELSGVSLKAVLVDDNGNPISYANIIRFPAGDVTGAVVSPYPYPSFASKDDYRRHLLYTNIYSGLSSGLKKWDLEGRIASENALENIVVFQTNPSDSSNYFTRGVSDSQYETIESKIRDNNDIGIVLRGSDLLDLSHFISENPQLGTNYEIIGNQIVALPGYVLVIPDKNLGAGVGGDTLDGYYQNNIATGIINRAVIRINPNLFGSAFKRAVSHEFKHAFNNPNDLPLLTQNPPTYDSQTLANTLTILRYDTPNITLGSGAADIEDAYFVNRNPPAGSSDDILGNW
ncbi:MAG TPA: hypothetical protein VMC07_02775 [Candidatus Omnitrophota bacterium]|nr:hypothetical protein [Candidatus Omnitrophota bacterium]